VKRRLAAILAAGFYGCGSPEPDPVPEPASGPSVEDTVDIAAETMEALPADEPAAPEPEPAPVEETAAAAGDAVTIYRDEWVRGPEGWQIQSRTLSNLYMDGPVFGPDEVELYPAPEPY